MYLDKQDKIKNKKCLNIAHDLYSTNETHVYSATLI